ncbi:MAG: D-aminoacyl-tRNA deacylase [Candidatus Undinarchaeales archaeon]
MKVIYWKDDKAGKNIAENLTELGLGNLLVESEKSILYSKEPEIETDLFIVASTHRSKTNKASLTVHPTGNWGSADIGGNEHELSYTSPEALAVGLRAINSRKIKGFDVSMEATHHGPTNWKTPLIFIEIGSTETEWKNKEAGKVIAESISEINDSEQEFENYVGFGGIHYCPYFTKRILENEEISVGHVAPKYAANDLDKKIIKEAFEKSNAEKALFDWKGLRSKERNKILNILEELGIDYERARDI